MASTLMTSHFLTTMERPSSWSLYFWTDAGNSSKEAEGEEGRMRWLGMMEASLSNQKSEREVRSWPFWGMDCK